MEGGPGNAAVRNAFFMKINNLDEDDTYLTTPAISWVLSGLAPRRAGVIVAYNTSHLRQGETMNTRMRRSHTAPAVTVVSTLFAVLWLALPAPPAASSSPDTPQDATPFTAGNAEPSPPPPRRLHSSLSMPYFSFAQPLTPRS